MNKFFKTREEATAFQAEHGGEIYSCTPRSKTKSAYMSVEAANNALNVLNESLLK